MTLTTAASSGGVWRLTIVCSASTICDATTTMSMPRCGQAAWVPRPRMVMPKLSAEASAGPGRMANSPASRFGRLCMPYTAAIGNFSNSPSRTITPAPATFSSAGWKMKCTVPSKLRASAR